MINVYPIVPKGWSGSVLVICLLGNPVKKSDIHETCVARSRIPPAWLMGSPGGETEAATLPRALCAESSPLEVGAETRGAPPEDDALKPEYIYTSCFPRRPLWRTFALCVHRRTRVCESPTSEKISRSFAFLRCPGCVRTRAYLHEGCSFSTNVLSTLPGRGAPSVTTQLGQNLSPLPTLSNRKFNSTARMIVVSGGI